MANGNNQRPQQYDVIVVGAGFSGLYMLYKLRKEGLSAIAFESGDNIGGTWFWNRYPGARCDVPSMQYSYQFDEQLQQEWEWPERYSAQPDILNYINHVADRFDLRRDIQLQTWVESATYKEEKKTWHVKTSKGEAIARFCVMATGCLSTTNTPDVPGIKTYAGEVFHTGNWPKDGVDFTDKTVGILGTGSSAIQSIPIIAQQAKHLYVFQRTPNFSVPAANGPTNQQEARDIKARYSKFRKECAAKVTGYEMHLNEKSAVEVDHAERIEEYERRWRNGGLMFLGAFSDLLLNQDANETAAEFIRQKISSIVENPKVAALLMPDHKVGCKRLCADSGYYATFNRDNVTLIDIHNNPISSFESTGLTTPNGKWEFQNLVLATGFDAMTGAISKINVTGKQGKSLRDKWTDDPKAYLGLGISGFPNLFTINGPGSPSVLTNMLPSIEQHVNWIADCINWTESNGFKSIEATFEAEKTWAEHVNEVADATIFPTCNSWYLGANIPGKKRAFLPYLGFPPYVDKCESVARNNYTGFEFS
jgi:cation diffusion facilitator CzcD-associated flavoprotein CzcO